MTEDTTGEVAQTFIDHMGGVSYIREYVEADASWLSMIPQLTDYLEQQVAYYVNAGVAGDAQSQRRKMISGSGFPAETQVNYSFIAPGGYTPWSSTEDREVKQVVLHSFGHQWHAYKSAGKWLGTMNQPSGVTMIGSDDDTEHVRWVPNGTNLARGMEHKGRLAAALNACMLPIPGNAGVHFIISRGGDLYIMADCNDTLSSCQDCSPTAISIALEEALYLEAPLGDPRPVATWLPTGSPLGTDGSLLYWDFSEQQYATLAVLLKKLQIAYPSLVSRTYTSSVGEATASFTGYTMHSHLKGADSRYVDVSPHLQDDAAWTALFDLVDKQEQISDVDVWLNQDTGYTSRLAWAENLVKTLQSLGNQGPASALMTSPALAQLLGILRAHNEFQNDNYSYRKLAATEAARSSINSKLQAGMETSVKQANTDPISVPGKPADGSAGTWDL